jgi:hypothetical protein
VDFLSPMFRLLASGISRVERALGRKTTAPPRDIVKLVDQMREDPIFCLAISVITGKIASAKVAFDLQVDPAHNHRAKPLQESFARVWEKTLPYALEAVEYGRQAFEKVFDYNETLRIMPISRLVKIPYRISKPIVSDGEFGEVEITKDGNKFSLSRDTVWWFALDATPDNPHGRSRYYGGPAKILQRRQRLDKLEDLFDDRFAIGNAVARYPTDRTYLQSLYAKGSIGEVDNNAKLIDPAGIMEAQAENMRAAGVILLPSDKLRTDQGGGFAWDWQDVGRELKSADPLVQRRTYLDVAALRAMGVPERAVIHESSAGGSYNLAEIHNVTLDLLCDRILGQCVESYQTDVVAETMVINGFAEDSCVATYQSLSDKSGQRLVDMILRVIEAPSVSPFILSGIVDVVTLLEQSGLPLGDGIGGDNGKDVYALLSAAIAKTMPGAVPLAA